MPSQEYSTGQLRIAVLFSRLGPYHHARLTACAGRLSVLALEMSSIDRTYGWDLVSPSGAFRQITLFPETPIEGIGPRQMEGRMNSALAQFRPDVVAIPGWADRAALTALRWCIRSGVPAVVMSESAQKDAHRITWKERFKSSIVSCCSAALVGGAPHVRYLNRLGMPESRVFTGYDVVDNEHFSNDRVGLSNSETLRDRLGLPRNYFIASSRFIQKKNLFRVIGAYARYRCAAGASAWKLVILGDGPLKGALLDYMARLGVTGDVMLPGFKQYQELPSYYCLAGAFVHGSTVEQWGLVVNEAMAAGLPVLVSNRCGCADDLVHDGVNGFRFDPEDERALAALMGRVSSPACNREAMGSMSRDIIARWGTTAFADGLTRAAECALDSAPPRIPFHRRLLLSALLNHSGRRAERV